MKTIIPFIFLLLSSVVSFGQTEAIEVTMNMNQAQARDLRGFIVPMPIVRENMKNSVFLFDTRKLNILGSKTPAHNQFFLKAPMKLQDVVNGYRSAHENNFYFSKQSTLLLFSKDKILKFSFFEDQKEMDDTIVNSGDIVILGNYGDYL